MHDEEHWMLCVMTSVLSTARGSQTSPDLPPELETRPRRSHALGPRALGSHLATVALTDAALAIRSCFAPVQPAGEQKQGRVQSILVRNQPAVEGTPMALEWQRLPWHTTEDDCSHASVMQKNRSTGGIGKSYALPDGDDADAS